jgi:ABC-type multidrug transport system fused ATPase/permease subunit
LTRCTGPGSERLWRDGVPALIEASAVTVRRGRRVILSGVSVAVSAGQVVHPAGADGSGKDQPAARFRRAVGTARRRGAVRWPVRCSCRGVRSLHGAEAESRA